MYIKTLVDIIKDQYQTNDPFKIAECMGIIIVENKLGQELRGAYHYYKRQKIIYLNDQYELASKRITCGHELGHAIIHPKENTMFLKNKTFFNGGKKEIEADKFAAHLLIDEDDKEILFEYGSVDASRILCVPEEFLLYTFQDLIPEEHRCNCRRRI